MNYRLKAQETSRSKDSCSTGKAEHPEGGYQVNADVSGSGEALFEKLQPSTEYALSKRLC